MDLIAVNRQFAGVANGLIMVSAFDSHVMGCTVGGGKDCSDSQTDFVDQNRMKYQVKSATFTAKRVPDNATCADVRLASPM